MRFVTTLFLLSSFRARSLLLVPQRPTHHPADRKSLSSASSKSSCATKLFSANAISANGARNDGAPNSDSMKINYGPSIRLGKLKLNLFGAIIGLWEIFCGVFLWYPAMALYGLARAISSKLPGDLLSKIDPYRRIPINFGFAWALLSYSLFGMWPAVEGRENLEVLRVVDENGKKGKLRPAMYVANHCSWMDIPFVAWLFGSTNYKFIAKAELNKIPIVGRAVRVGGHVMLDRSNRRSQMAAYKAGVQWLKDGVNLVTFPEGTRSKNGRMGSFKKGAFKMAQAVGMPVVPITILNADKVQPIEYVFPAKPSWKHPRAVIKIGKPITTAGKQDDELLEEVWQTIADELPESQKPAKDTPVGVK